MGLGFFIRAAVTVGGVVLALSQGNKFIDNMQEGAPGLSQSANKLVDRLTLVGVIYAVAMATRSNSRGRRWRR